VFFGIIQAKFTVVERLGFGFLLFFFENKKWEKNTRLKKRNEEWIQTSKYFDL
jgi:hypothetical protein